MTRGRLAAPTLTALACAALVSAVFGSQAQGGFETGVSSSAFQSSDVAVRDQAVAEAAGAGVNLVRLDVGWSSVAKTEPSDPADPADPAYSFRALDNAVLGAEAQGLDALITVQSAPSFAEGPKRPKSAPAGTWKPQAGDLEKFATALAARYSGNFAGLPRVRYFQAWNEPNLPEFITPQYEGRKLVSTGIYRRMLNGFYDGAKSVDRSNVVVSGGTAPYGDRPGGQRTRPLTFIRDLLCVSKGGKATRCPEKAKFDVLAHHPINTSGGPSRSAIHPDDASTPDFKNVGRILHQAEQRRTLGTGGRHSLWATEIWWESNPPDRKRGVPLATQARYLEEALYILWKQGAEAVINFQLRDPQRARDITSLDSGLYFADGRAKPALTAFRFPFVTERSGNGGKVRAWGRAPVGGSLAIQVKRGKNWRTVKQLNAGAGKVFTTSLALKGKQSLRALVGGEQSLVWSQE